MYLHICKHGPILFAPTKADPSRGEGSHSPSGPSLSLPCRMVTKKEKEKKSLFSGNTILQSARLLITTGEKKIFTVNLFGKAYFLRDWTRGFPQLSRSLQSHLYIPACREEHANTFHRFLELRGKTELDFSAAHRRETSSNKPWEAVGSRWF